MLISYALILSKLYECRKALRVATQEMKDNRHKGTKIRGRENVKDVETKCFTSLTKKNSRYKLIYFYTDWYYKINNYMAH